jgi:hypothetical protein
MARRQKRQSKDEISLSILLCNEASPKGVVWIAQCLEWDIAGQGESPTAALQAFEHVFWAHVMRNIEKNQPLFGSNDPAPDELHEQFRTGWAFREPYAMHPPASVRVPRVEANDIRLAA